MERHPYRNGNDLKQAQTALMQWTQEVGHCNYLHKGDIGHRLFNGGYLHEPQEMFFYWTDSADNLIAFVMIYPPSWEGFELFVAPALRYTETHSTLFQWCEAELMRFAERNNVKLERLAMESQGCDEKYDVFLHEYGYQRGKQIFQLTEHDLSNIPDVKLPDGFWFHDATEADILKLVDVHNRSFSPKWDEALYGRVFRAPHMEREIVVIAPDGRFAAFTNVWHDDVNRSILFEPMGTHAEFRRMGLARALMGYVMRRMQAEYGIERAFVCHEMVEKNPAAVALYANVGFRPKYEIIEWVKLIQSGIG